MTMSAEDLILSAETSLLDRVVSSIRERVSTQGEAAQIAGSTFDRDDELRLARAVADQVIRADRADRVGRGNPRLPAGEEERVIAEAMTLVFGVGQLSSLMEDPDIWEININAPDQIFASSLTRGKVQVREQLFSSNQDIIDWVTQIGMNHQRNGTRSWDTAKGTIECQLYMPENPGAHNARIVAVQGANEACQVSIRLLRNKNVELDDFVQWRSCTPEVASLIRACVLASLNVLLVGQTGSGKTTLARAMLNLIPEGERIFVVEHFTELGGALNHDRHPDAVSWQEREGNVEGAGELNLEDLVSITRRLDPDRIIVGECMGPEIVPFLRALTQGNDGGFTTMHARGLHEVAPRLLGYAAEAGLRHDVAQPLIGLGVDVLVFFEMERSAFGRPPRRWISQIAEFDYDGDRLRLNVVYDDPGTGTAVYSAPFSERLRRRLGQAGWAEPGHMEVLR